MYEDELKQAEEKLYKAAIRAIKAFCKEEPTTEVRCFFLDSDDVAYGRVGISIDSVSNNSDVCLDSFKSTKKSRRATCKGKRAWELAKHGLNCPSLEIYNTDSGDFDFGEFAEVDLSEWRKIAKKNGVEKSDEDGDDSYIEGNARISMWRTIERLVKERAFDSMKTSSPFFVGFSFHDDGPTTVDILKWPK
ncbi:hypothetical protein [Aureliella helgolandensis]|uniref:Uncharacterized protein n=1 Tax=Aureliella helgolandensis TaxID=2527968 RepID=A0A518GBB1_9BACT|nr:hypothetical protein [Aureliella helgolandensis]QDV25853.1 hypothetical protein Q31a_41810 [Aureliella helgolandensis]